MGLLSIFPLVYSSHQGTAVTADLQSRSFVIEHRADDDATTNCEEGEGIECLVARIGYYIYFACNM